MLSLKTLGLPVTIPLWILYQVGRLGVKAVKHPVKTVMNIGAFPFLALWWTGKGAYNLTVDTLKDWRSFLIAPIGLATAVRVARHRRKSPDEPSVLFGVLATAAPAALAAFVAGNFEILKPLAMNLVASLKADPRLFTSLPMAYQAVIVLAGTQVLSILVELARSGKMSIFGDKKNIPSPIEMKPTNTSRDPYDYLTMFNWITDRKQLTEIEGKWATVKVAYLLATGAINDKDAEDFRKRISDRLPAQAVCG